MSSALLPRTLLVVMLAAAVLLGPACAKDKILAQGVVDVTVVGIESGDYVHLLVRDAAGKQRSFFAAPATPSDLLARIIEKPDTFRGTRIRLTWQRVSTFVPEAGAAVTIERAVKAVAR